MVNSLEKANPSKTKKKTTTVHRCTTCSYEVHFANKNLICYMYMYSLPFYEILKSNPERVCRLDHVKDFVLDVIELDRVLLVLLHLVLYRLKLKKEEFSMLLNNLNIVFFSPEKRS